MRSIAIGLLLVVLLSALASAQTPGERTQILADFQERLADYARQHECLDPGHAAGPSRIVTPAAATVLRQLMATVPEGQAPSTVMRATGAGSPGRRPVTVGEPVPGDALRPFPPALTSVLPPLPPRFEYRLIGEDLVLRDLNTDRLVAVLHQALRPSVAVTPR